MKLLEAHSKLNKIADIPFGELFSSADIKDISKNKGKTGQLLELALGIHLSSNNLDFEDGELKTNKCDCFGNPLETIRIIQISKVIDLLIKQHPFEETALYRKIVNILYVPVCKEGKPENWRFLPSIHIDLNTPMYSDLLSILESDYYIICLQLKNSIETAADGFIHTANGKYLQIRSKDAKPYHPIYSNYYNRLVSNKNHAFYFQKQFVYDIKNYKQQ